MLSKYQMTCAMRSGNQYICTVKKLDLSSGTAGAVLKTKQSDHTTICSESLSTSSLILANTQRKGNPKMSKGTM